MPQSDAFVVGNDFVSEHFFTSDATKETFLKFVLDRRKAWDAAEHETSRARFTKSRGAVATQLASIYADPDHPDAATAAEVYPELRRILGYATGEFATTTSGPITWFNTPGVTGQAPFALVEAAPVDALEELLTKADQGGARLLQPWPLTDTLSETALTDAVTRLLVGDDPVEFVLVLAGRWALVTQAARWAEGRYLAVDLQTVCDRNETKRGGEIDRALMILDAESLAPDADGKVTWAEILDDAVKHTIGVSKNLREGVRRSIEIIANEVVARRAEQGLAPLAADQAQPLARQSLRFLYRILFLLYAEASPEMGVLPVGAPEYDAGYSLDRLRELTLVELASPQARAGTHLYDSLAVLFRLIDRGHAAASNAEAGDAEGLEFHALRADLFRPDAIALISETKLGNEALQTVLRYLLLSREQKGRERGFISYVDLGINQLGAVYEGLMSYSGFFAEDDLYEVARGGNPEKGSWVVPIERAQGIAPSDFVTADDPVTGEKKPIIHKRGQFVFRLSGRARQQSASYYTPEVLTEFTVEQALAELLDQEGRRTTSEEILNLTVCEPALGSGAFAIEAVRQLGEQYLKRRAEETGREIPPEDYQSELQRVKAYLALHNVYGVDLNATAVEFAEITLWLATMAKGLDAPWFGLHLRRGNSLIGARRAVYTRGDVTSKAWRDKPADDLPLADLGRRVHDDAVPSELGGRIHHFLLPAAGWGATADSKEAKVLAPDRVKAVKEWRKQFAKAPTPKQLDKLVAIADAADELWTMALRRLTVADQQTRRSIALFEQDAEPTEGVVTREQIEDSLADPNGAYQRLRLVMDAWCALWFWPLVGDEVTPPSWAAWILALEMVLGATPRDKASRKHWTSDQTLTPDDLWGSLADQESFQLASTGAAFSIDKVFELHPWLRVVRDVADQQGFFHWPLEFGPVFARGGFDLQVGNPPWVRPRGDVPALLAEGDPWWQLTDKPSTADAKVHREMALAVPGVEELVVDADAATVALASYVGAVTNYPDLAGLQPDLYRCFMAQTWGHLTDNGSIGLLHPETHLTDEKAGALRISTYSRLRRHWQFVNELQLFDEVHHLVSYGVHVYGTARAPHFLQASALYHPDTVRDSLLHTGIGSAPGFKHEGKWDQRAHKSRIETVTDQTLALWRDLLDPDLLDPRRTRTVYTVNRDVASVLETLAAGPRLAEVGLQFSAGWHEKNDRTQGYFVQRWGDADWSDAILQGPHLHVNTPLYKSPNATMKHNLDWADTDLEALPSNALPNTSYKPAGDPAKYERDYTHWTLANGDSKPARDFYRLAWRRMAANTGERTLISALIPPGTAHVNPVYSVGGIESRTLVTVAAATSSLLLDFAIRSVPKSDIHFPTLQRLPRLPQDHPLIPGVLLRTLRLNCVTDAYADLWAELWDPAFTQESWTRDGLFCDLGEVGPQWTAATPLRRAADRRQAQVEIDTAVAIMLGVSADELCTVYRTQFAVLYGYDHDQYTFDANGRIVPNLVLVAYRKKGERLTVEERTHTNQAGNTYVYEFPFATRDREEDMRTAYHALEAGS